MINIILLYNISVPNISYLDDIVLDPFDGVGTTTLVAYKLRRKYNIGIDISEDYCKTAEERLKNKQRQTRLF